MKVDVLSLLDGQTVTDGATDLSFGVVKRGLHCGSPVLIKFEKTVESEVLGIKVFLQDDGGLTGSSFGYFVSPSFTGGIDYTNLLTEHFTVVPGMTGGWPHGVTGPFPPYWDDGVDVGITGGAVSDHMWLDVEAGASGPLGTSQANFMVVYDFN